MKKMKTERESASDFLILPLLLQYLMAWMITKRLKGYVPYIYGHVHSKEASLSKGE